MRPAKRRIKKLQTKHNLIGKLFSDQEWIMFRAEELPEDLSKTMHDQILNEVSLINEKEEQQKRLRLKLIYTGKYLAAASIILLVGSGLWFIASPNSSKQALSSSTNKLITPTTIQWEEIKNTSINTHKLTLSDSSIVKLYPQSSIKFEKSFKKYSRDIYLTGKALFEVKKDPKRPFSVYASDLKTTALGTAFTINTNESGNRTSVKLHHGKIEVSNSSTPTEQPIYISQPGAGLIYNPGIKTLALVPTKVSLKPVPETAISFEGNTIVLKNIPLSKVIQILQDTYQVKIDAESSILSNTTYTGTVDPQKESAEEVLKVICVINNLTLQNDSEQNFTIKKSN